MLSARAAKDIVKNYLSAVILLTFASVSSGEAILTVGNGPDFESFGNLVEVDVTIFGLTTTLNAFQFDIDFTPGVLSGLGANVGTIENIDNVGGTAIGIARSSVGLNFGGTLVRFFFRAIGEGLSPLSIPASSVTLLDSDGNEIAFTTTGAYVVVGPQPIISTPEPGSLWLSLIGIAGIVAFHLKQRRLVSDSTNRSPIRRSS